MNQIVSNPTVTPLTIEVIFEHADFVLVNKPEGLSFHFENDMLGFFDLVKSFLQIPLWPVHRLDKLTSGIIIFAKTQIAANHFRLMFENKEIDKTYIAISDKKPKKKQGKIIGDMKKSRNGNWILTQNKTNPAKTQFKSFNLIPKLRLFVVKPLTGKTHQIRVALKSLGSPILGDSRYGGNDSDRAYLHACKISFNWNKELIEFINIPTQGELFKLPELQNVLKDVFARDYNKAL